MRHRASFVRCDGLLQSASSTESDLFNQAVGAFGCRITASPVIDVDVAKFPVDIPPHSNNTRKTGNSGIMSENTVNGKHDQPQRAWLSQNT